MVVSGQSIRRAMGKLSFLNLDTKHVLRSVTISACAFVLLSPSIPSHDFTLSMITCRERLVEENDTRDQPLTFPTADTTITMKVTIKKWNAVATWRWDIPEDDVCGICQVHFDGTCPACKYPGDECRLCKSASISRVSLAV